jgi:hypothetical protein
VALYSTVEESRSLFFLYLVDEVKKEGLLMVFLEWMTQLWVEYSVVGRET